MFRRLQHAHGPQHWWPATSPFEVMVGAILTQNTAWTNVERALARLTTRCKLDADALLALTEAELADAIRPAGYFNVKARRLRAFCAALQAAGGEAGLAAQATAQLRRTLLAINGVGPETADDMLLYAFARPVFVVDAYTRRLFTRLGVLRGDEGYETIRARFEDALDGATTTTARDADGADEAAVGAEADRQWAVHDTADADHPTADITALYNEYHALIVRHAKEVCRARAPRCPACCLADICPAAVEASR